MKISSFIVLYSCVRIKLINSFVLLFLPLGSKEKWKWKSLSRVWLFVTPWTIQSRLYSRPEYWSQWPSLLQGIFPTQGLNIGLPHCRQILHPLNHKGSPWIMEWVAYPFSGGSSQPRNRTGVSCIAGGFLTNWTMREAPRKGEYQILAKMKHTEYDLFIKYLLLLLVLGPE